MSHVNYSNKLLPNSNTLLSDKLENTFSDWLVLQIDTCMHIRILNTMLLPQAGENYHNVVVSTDGDVSLTGKATVKTADGNVSASCECAVHNLVQYESEYCRQNFCESLKNTSYDIAAVWRWLLFAFLGDGGSCTDVNCQARFRLLKHPWKLGFCE